MSRRIFLDQLRRNGKFVVPLVATVALMVPQGPRLLSPGAAGLWQL